MSIYMSRNFRYSEIACPCCGKDRPLDPKLIYLLQSLRDKIGKPIYITSGLRCKKYNKKIGGYIRSPHVPFYVTIKSKKVLRGCSAVDIHAKNMDIVSLAKQAKDIGFTRIGLYPFSHFIHVDVLKPQPSASWIRFLAGNYVYLKTLEEAIKRIGGKY